MVSLYVGIFVHDGYLARFMLTGRVCYPHHQSWTFHVVITRILQDICPLGLERINEGVLHNYYVDQYRNSNTVDGQNPAPPGMVKTL